MEPVILSMEVDDDNSWDSYYRLRIGSQVKYLVISPGTFDRDTLSLPLQSLPKLPTGEWTMAKISRDKATGDLRTGFSNHVLSGVRSQWHPASVDCLELERSNQLTASAFEVITPRSIPAFDASSPATMIAKIARFEWEVPRIEQETIAYQLLEGSGLAPRFLAHIHENGRIMGFLLEKLKGRHASIQDLSACEAVLKRFHERGLLHGDVNRHNFIVQEDGIKLLDFENFQENASPELMQKELENLSGQLVEESGRGGGFMPWEDSD